MERQIADTNLPKSGGTWEPPTVTEIRVSAEVTAYAGIWAEAE
ncbi:pyrroloquinoline quinone precursor peptide PqqA [Nocardioides sp. KR10-350]